MGFYPKKTHTGCLSHDWRTTFWLHQLAGLFQKDLISSNKTSWWFQPIWKNISQIGSFPQVGMKIWHIWNHHLEKDHQTNPTQKNPRFPHHVNVPTSRSSRDLRFLQTAITEATSPGAPKWSVGPGWSRCISTHGSSQNPHCFNGPLHVYA